MATGNFPSERLIVFSSLILQCDRSVKKGNDIRRLLERRFSLWKEEKFSRNMLGVIMLSNTKGSHIDSAEVEVRAAVRWITDRSNCRLLEPTDEIEVKEDDGSIVRKSVIDIYSKLNTRTLIHLTPHPYSPLMSFHFSKILR